MALLASEGSSRREREETTAQPSAVGLGTAGRQEGNAGSCVDASQGGGGGGGA